MHFFDGNATKFWWMKIFDAFLIVQVFMRWQKNWSFLFNGSRTFCDSSYCDFPTRNLFIGKLLLMFFFTAFGNRPLRALLAPITSSNLMGHCESCHRFYWFLWSVFPQFFYSRIFYSNIDLNWLTQWHFHIYMWWAARRKAFLNSKLAESDQKIFEHRFATRGWFWRWKNFKWR